MCDLVGYDSMNFIENEGNLIGWIMTYILLIAMLGLISTLCVKFSLCVKIKDSMKKSLMYGFLISTIFFLRFLLPPSTF